MGYWTFGGLNDSPFFYNGMMCNFFQVKKVIRAYAELLPKITNQYDDSQCNELKKILKVS
jgi:hypothetical protein